MGQLLIDRRKYSELRLKELQKHLTHAEKYAADKACVYAIGSFARGEATEHSDLDLFIAGKTVGHDDDRALSGLDEICIKAELIDATRKLKLPDFSGDGQYVVHYTVKDLTATLGQPDDDARNTFTARLLMLLESRPLVGERCI